MKCFHAHTPSHSPTPSHMPMPSVAIVTGNTNDTHIPSLCQLSNTQCKLLMGNQSRVNLDSYHSTLGLSDKRDHAFSFGQRNFSAYTAGLLHPRRTFWIAPGSLTPIQNFSDNTTGLSHPYRILGSCHGFLTPTQNFSPEGTNSLFLASPNTH